MDGSYDFRVKKTVYDSCWTKEYAKESFVSNFRDLIEDVLFCNKYYYEAEALLEEAMIDLRKKFKKK